MRYPIWILILSGLSVACFGQLEFVGFTNSNEGMRFVLKDMKENRASEWLRLEQSFRGFKLVTYDPQRELVIVEKEGERFELPLRTPVAQSATPSREVVDEPRKYKVGSVIIKAAGDVAFPEKVVREAMQIRPGGTFDVKSLDQDIRSIYRTGQFKFVEIKHEKGAPDSFDLVVIVTPKVALGKEPNKAPEPTPGAVAARGTEGDSK